MSKTWYTAKTGNHQGLIIEEETGRNVAVAYDAADAPLLSAAPDLLAACKGLEDDFPSGQPGNISSHVWDQIAAAIAKAEGSE